MTACKIRPAAAALFYRVARVLPFSVLVACGATPTATPSESGEEPGPELALALQIHEAPANPELDMPRSEIRVILVEPSGERREESVGTYSGICQPAALSDALVGVSCWWAGSGEDIRVRQEGDRLVVTRTPQEEMAEGDFAAETLTTLVLPARASVRPLTGMP